MGPGGIPYPGIGAAVDPPAGGAAAALAVGGATRGAAVRGVPLPCDDRFGGGVFGGG